MQIRLYTLLLAAILTVLGPALACDSHVHSDPADVVLDNTSDEALASLIDAGALSDPTKARTFDAPAANATLGATPFAFAWRAPGTSAATPGAPAKATARFDLGPALGLRDAWAHGPAVHGKAYLLTVSSPTNPKLFRVFTTKTTFTPAAAAWASIVAGGGSRTATVTMGIFDDSNLAADGGPFAGQPVAFQVAP